MGSLIQASWEGFILKAGLEGNVFNFPECVTLYVTPTWLTHTWKSCCEGNIQIIGDTTGLTPPKQQDKELICLFILTGYCKTNLAIISAVCM